MDLFERLHVLHRAWRYRLRADRDELAFLFNHNLVGQTVLDIGANHGIYSYWMQKCVGPTGAVVAFEPQPELCEYLQDLKAAFSLHSVQIANVALSSESGEATLTRPKGHWGGASLNHVEQSDVEQLRVDKTTLDGFLERHPSLAKVGFIKCDVEGHELEVFEGAQKTLAHDRPDIVFECYDDKVLAGKLFSLLGTLGYDGFFFHQRKLTSVDRWSELRPLNKRPFLNYVFVHRENSGAVRRAA